VDLRHPVEGSTVLREPDLVRLRDPLLGMGRGARELFQPEGFAGRLPGRVVRP